MVTLDELARLALELPGVAEVDRRSWAGGPVVVLVTDGLDDKQALLAAQPGHLFTIPHFDGYPALPVDLEKASVIEVTESLLDAWLVRVLAELAERHLGGR